MASLKRSLSAVRLSILPANTAWPLLPVIAIVIVIVVITSVSLAVSGSLRRSTRHYGNSYYGNFHNKNGDIRNKHHSQNQQSNNRLYKDHHSNGHISNKGRSGSREASAVLLEAVVVDFYVVTEDRNAVPPTIKEGGDEFCPHTNMQSCAILETDQLKLRKPKPPLPPRKLPPMDTIPDELREFMSKPIVNSHKYRFNFNLDSFCKSRTPDIIMMISSRPEHVYRRREIREDKLDMLNLSKMFRIKPLFFTGHADPRLNNSDLAESLISLEAESYSDIVQADFIDVFENRTLKAVSMLNWLLRYCSTARYVIFTTDSVTLNNKVISTLRRIGRSRENFILGQVMRSQPISSVPSNEYFLADSSKFPENVFPPFLERGLWGFPLHTARLLYEASLRIEPMSMEDVYLTAVCAASVGVSLVEDLHFRFDPRMLDDEDEVI